MKEASVEDKTMTIPAGIIAIISWKVVILNVYSERESNFIL
jgi:hypothetical protein